MTAMFSPASVKIQVLDESPLDTPCDCLVLLLTADSNHCETAQAVDKQSGQWISQSITEDLLSTDFGDLVLIPKPVHLGLKSKAALLVGVGAPSELTRGKVFDLGAMIVRRLADKPREQIVICVQGVLATDMCDSFVAGAVFGCEGQSIHMAESKHHPPQSISIAKPTVCDVDCGIAIGQSLNLTRRLVNEPANVIFPQSFAEAASEVAKEVDIAVEVWDDGRLLAEGCRAMLAIGAASAHPPHLVILRYQGAESTNRPVLLVGKGVTFDSGGLSIKPTEGMVDMKCDMAGAATVLGAIRAAALLKLTINVTAICAMAENMISSTAVRLGDVIESRQGTTIEIMNTDAEGRVVLADALDVAVQQQPQAIVDLATLTGACMVALGRDVVGLMTNHSELASELKQAAERQGEMVWELPMHDFYGEQIKSKVADIKNTGDGRWGGAITAAKFLERFVNDVPWVHFDIAGPAFADASKPHRDAGATGVMLRTLVAWLQARAAS